MLSLLLTIATTWTPPVGPALLLRCHAQEAHFIDGSSFPKIEATLVIDPAAGWRIDYDQVYKRFPDGVTIIVARDSGRLEKIDRASHLQVGMCRTLTGAP